MPRSSSIGSADRGAARSIVDSVAFALALTVVLGVVYAVISKVALDAFPYSGDEYSTYLQAQLFAAGQLHAAAPAHAAWLRVDHVVIDHLIRSKYPPGASALLALGLRAGAVWLVTPIEAVIALVLVWATVRRELGPRAGLVALITLGIAPLFVFNAGTFYAHTAATMFLAVAFAAVAAWTHGRRTGWLALAGVAIGCAFLVRPSDGLLFGVALLCFRNVRAVVVPALCALPLVGVNLWYQAAQFGSPLTDGYHAYEPTFTALYGASTAAHPLSPRHLVSIVQWWNHLDIYRALVVDWTIPGCAVVALVGALALKDHPVRKLSLALIAVFAVVLLAMISDPDDGARPRYLSIVLIPLAFLTAAGFQPSCEALAARLGRPIQRALVAIAVVFALAQTGSILQEQIPKLWLRQGLYQAVAAAHLHDAVVIVRARYPSRYARNGPWFDGDALYLSVPPDVTAGEVAAAFPGKAVWEAHEGVPWQLTRVPSAAGDCAKLDAPAQAMFDEMDRYITAMQQAVDAAGSDCAKLTAGLRALDTDGYLRTMQQAAIEMKPDMTPACQAHLDELGQTAETRFKPRFAKVLDEVNALGPKCPEPETQAAIASAMRVYKKKHDR